MSRALAVIALALLLGGCSLQNRIFGKCSPYSAPNARCVK